MENSTAKRKSATVVRYALPDQAAEICAKCAMWWVPYTTRVRGSGWYLCGQCHDGPAGKPPDEIPWEQRRIRVLGVKGSPAHARLHRLGFDACT